MAVTYSQNGVIVRNSRVNEEPSFTQVDKRRINYPTLPNNYTKVFGIRLTNPDTLFLGVTPNSSDEDIYIYIAFKCISISLVYTPIITTNYIDEETSVVRLITDNYSKSNFYTNLFTAPKDSTPVYNSNNIFHALILKSQSNRIFYNEFSSNSYRGTFVPNQNITELTIFNPSMVCNLYGLYVRQNGVVYHNWVPCVRNSDNACGFYNAVDGEFITSSSMSVISS